MPRLILFAPCEKVIISQDENNPTLIAVLHGINGQYQFDPNVPHPEKLILPYRWSIFAMWRLSDEEHGKTFEQTVRFVAPSGRSNPPAMISFTVTQPIQRTIIQIGNLTASENGLWTLQLFINEAGTELSEQPIATYPLDIDFVEMTPGNPLTELS